MSASVRAAARATAVQAMEDGRDPLDIVLQIAENPKNDPELRLKAAATALPYMRPRLSMQVSADVTPKDGEEGVSHADLVDRMSRMLEPFARKAARQIEHDPAKIHDVDAENLVAKDETHP